MIYGLYSHPYHSASLIDETVEIVTSKITGLKSGCLIAAICVASLTICYSKPIRINIFTADTRWCASPYN